MKQLSKKTSISMQGRRETTLIGGVLFAPIFPLFKNFGGVWPPPPPSSDAPVSMYPQHLNLGLKITCGNLSSNKKCECNVILVWLFLICEGPGFHSMLPDIKGFLRIPKLPKHGTRNTALWEYSSELYIKVSSIERLRPTF